jgi:outer membrane receptor protein involved in Fe transport
MSHSPSAIAYRRSVLATLLLGASLVAPMFLLAQEPAPDERSARLQGVVMVETTSEAIIGATVTVVGTEVETVTGPLGLFAIAGAPLGTQWVRVAAVGFPAVREMVEITENGIVFMQFRMPDDLSAVLDEVVVQVIDPDVASVEAGTALDLLAIQIPGIVAGTSGFVGSNRAFVRLRGVSSLTQDGDPIIVLDDVALTGDRPPLEILSEIPAADVEKIEVLRGPTAAFLYPFASNGVIRIKTRRR